MKRPLFVVVLAFACHALPAEAQTDPASTPRDNRARAQQLFDSALADAEAGNFVAACPKFLASQDADPKTSTLMNLANCYQHNAQSASAWGAFREAEIMARKAGRPELESAARARATALEPKLLRLNIVVPEASRLAGLVVTRDGALIPAGEWGVAIPVDPGEHVLTASADGHKSWAEHVAIEAESKTITLPALEPAPVEPTPTAEGPLPPPPPKGLTTLQTVGIGGAGIGVAAMIGGGVLALVAKGSYDDAKSLCRGGSTVGCPAGAVSDADSAYTKAAVATGIFITGAVLVAAGATLFFVAPDRKRQRFAFGPAGVAGTF